MPADPREAGVSAPHEGCKHTCHYGVYGNRVAVALVPAAHTTPPAELLYIARSTAIGTRRRR